MLTDLKFAFRQLAKSPGYTVIALLTLALGIGVNTAMFSVVKAFLFDAAPFPEPQQLVQVTGLTRTGDMGNFSVPEIRELRAQAGEFSSLTTVGFGVYAWAEPDRPAERLTGLQFSGDMIDTFRVQPLIGRIFAADEFETGKDNVILLGETFWRSRFNSDPNVIGRSMRLDGELVTVVGVLPAHFEYRLYWGEVAFWRPLNFTPEQISYRGYRNFMLIGRLQPGSRASTAAARLEPLAARLEKEFPQEYPGLRFRAVPLNEAAMDDIGRAISWTLFGLSGFVLLIACANLANLQLVRTIAARRDFAIRAAVGASRGRLALQQLTESLVLSLAGGAFGYLVAKWITGLLERNLLIGGDAPGFQIPMDTPVLVAALAVSIMTGMIFGIVPAVTASQTDVNSALKAQSRGSTDGRGHRRLRNALIVGEVALALVLLGGAAIMNRGFAKLLQRKVGWDLSLVVSASLPVPESRYGTPEKRVDLFRKLEARLAELPGVEHVALATSLPLFGYTSDRQVFVDSPGGNQPSGNPVASHVMVSADYLATLGIPLLDGRLFPRELRADGPAYILVNESLARHFWPGKSAVGQRLGVSDNNKTQWREVIGVVGNVEPAGNIANPSTPFTVYKPLIQEPWGYVNLVVRSSNPSTLSEPLRRAVYEVDADLPLDRAGTTSQFVERAQHNLIVLARMLGGFAVLGLALAAIGLYGVVSTVVAQRTPEFGIRLALGAQPRDILASVLHHVVRLVSTGLAIGLAGAWGLGRFLSSTMPRLTGSVPFSISIVAIVLFLVAVLACWLPARRATTINPIDALRAD